MQQDSSISKTKHDVCMSLKVKLRSECGVCGQMREGSTTVAFS